MYIIFFLICFISCTVGAVCGIGGGVIIKPVLDTFGILSVAEISFLSGCTVLAMTCYSVSAALVKRESVIKLKTSMPLAIGSAVGGVLGKQLFSALSAMFENANRVGAVQAICLFILILGSIIYTLLKDKIKTKHTENMTVCLVIGLSLGLISSFLGIGGGPFNLVVLYYFFSLSVKAAAQNSLYIIMFAQITSLLQTLVNGAVPSFDILLCTVMIIGGIMGGIMGRRLSKRLSEDMVTRLFILLMVLIMFISVFNAYKYF